MMAMTTNSSIKVNAMLFLTGRFKPLNEGEDHEDNNWCGFAQVFADDDGFG